MNIYKKYNALLFVIVCLFFLHSNAWANISLPAIFGDHMVMQKNAEVKIWGWGNPLEEVSVVTSWSTDTLKTLVDNQANWSLVLNTPEAGGPHTVKIQGYNAIQISDILMGDVWLLSGQSNMAWTAGMKINQGEEAIKEVTEKEIRFFSVTNRTSNHPNYDVDGQWLVCSPETMVNFSAIGYFFGKKLYQELHIPVGLINASWGGSPIEVWIPEQEITSDSVLLEASKAINEMKWAPHKPGLAYNAMIAPIMPFPISGALWYQGETNTANPKTYVQMLSTLVTSWRDGFKNDFPFYYAQIAPYNDYGPNAGVMVREQQRRALSIPNTAMVVVSDIGDTTDIHPKNKIDAGNRFADIALNKAYKKSDFPVSGPLFKSYSVKGSKVEVEFDFAEGLTNEGDALQQFEIMNNEGEWFKAKAKIIHNRVVLTSSKVKNPIHVRFAWSNTATPKLMNKYHLPASCFNTNPKID